MSRSGDTGSRIANYTVPVLTESDFTLDEVLKSPAARKLLGVSNVTLSHWRSHPEKSIYRCGPPCLKIGRDFFYPKKFLLEWKAYREAVLRARHQPRNELSPAKKAFPQRLAEAVRQQPAKRSSNTRVGR